MSEILYSLALLACPVGMGAMMWFMMRRKPQGAAPEPPQDADLTRMRAEIDQLRAAQRGSGVPEPR